MGCFFSKCLRPHRQQQQQIETTDSLNKDSNSHDASNGVNGIRMRDLGNKNSNSGSNMSNRTSLENENADIMEDLPIATEATPGREQQVNDDSK